MPRAKGVKQDAPDVIVHTDDDGNWRVFCRLCPRETNVCYRQRDSAYFGASEHLLYTHALHRVWIEDMREGFEAMVNVALPLIVEHDMQTVDHVRAR